MTGSAAAPGASGALQLVAPALLVQVVIRPMTKVLNPVIVKFAGRSTSRSPRRSTT
jgi:hypothetical protein